MNDALKNEVQDNTSEAMPRGVGLSELPPVPNSDRRVSEGGNAIRQTTDEQIAVFMGQVVPWPSSNEPGYINVHWKDPAGRGGVPGYACRTLEELNAWLAWLRKKPWDLWFCVSRQSQHGKVDRRGNPMADRHANNALALKAIWLDVDVKPEKGYGTLGEALDAIAAFVAGAALSPPSALVFSGGGVHVYWISDKPLTRAEWLPYANGLRVQAERLALKCDYGLTVDAARILRVPGTYNYKTGQPRAVLLKHLGESYDFANTPGLSGLASIVLSAGAGAGTSKPTGPTPFDMSMLSGKPAAAFAHLKQASLSAGINTYADAPLEPDEIIKCCPHFQDAAINHGKDYSQGLWNLDMLAATFMEKGRRWGHYFSKGYATYSDDETDKMYDRKVAERASLGLGWPSCNAFENEGCKQCAACAYRRKIKSPLSSPPLVPVRLLDPPRRRRSEALRVGTPLTYRCHSQTFPIDGGCTALISFAAR